MPAIFHQPTHRRDFLKLSTLGAATIITACRTPVPRASDSAPKEFHVALLSDTHIPGDRLNGHRGFNPWQNLQRIVPDVLASQPEGVIINGDAARLMGLPGDYAELTALLQPLAGKAPVYIGLGNHDDRANFHTAFPQLPGQRAPVSEKYVLVVDHPVIRIVLLDSLDHVNKAPGLLGDDQLQWIKAYLTAHTDRPVAIFVHHTLGSGGNHLTDAGRLFETLAPHPQVKAIFYGHSHVWEITERAGLRLVNLPAVGYNFNDDQPVGWVSARFHPAGVDLTLHAFGGNRSADGTTHSVRWA